MPLVNLIDYTNFKDSLQIASSTAVAKSTLNEFITEYQERILRDLLGDDLYDNLSDNSADPEFVLLIDGEIYTNSGKNIIYKGLKPILTNFVWFYYMNDKESFDTSTGNVSSANVNSEKLYNHLYRKSVRAWNEGVALYCSAVDYINFKNSETSNTYPNFEYKLKEKINVFGL